MNILKQREERIKIFLYKGYTVDVENGIVYNSRGVECKSLKNGYIILSTNFNKKLIKILAHQLIYYVSTNEIVEQIDHIDGDRANNRIDNLREVTNQENSFNQTKAKGYTWYKSRNKWMARIMVDGKLIHLKCWNTEQEARQAYLDAKKKYHIVYASST